MNPCTPFCRTEDRRSKHQKLRDVINHPRTGEGERNAARAALARLGPEKIKTPPPYKVPPSFRPPPRPQTSTSNNPYISVDEWLRMVNEMRGSPYQSARTFNEAMRQAQQQQERYNEALRRSQQAMTPKCPGCGHAERFHVSFRCYECAIPKGVFFNTPDELEEFIKNIRAKECGWVWTMMRPSGQHRWVRIGGEPV